MKASLMDEIEREKMSALISQSVDKFMNRQIHEKLTARIIRDTPDNELEQVIVDYIKTKIPDDDFEFSVVLHMSLGLQMIYSTWLLESEVNNGGFNQFFINSSGEFADMALKSLKLLGATDFYSIMQRAIDIFEAEKRNPELQDLYAQGTAQAFSETYQLTKLGECDDDFYKLGDRLSKLKIQYVRSHPKEFVERKNAS